MPAATAIFAWDTPLPAHLAALPPASLIDAQALGSLGGERPADEATLAFPVGAGAGNAAAGAGGGGATAAARPAGATWRSTGLGSGVTPIGILLRPVADRSNPTNARYSTLGTPVYRSPHIVTVGSRIRVQSHAAARSQERSHGLHWGTEIPH